MRNIWKWVGLASVVGVAAGGALVVRDQQKRRAYTPDEIRDRLHQRLAESDLEGSQGFQSRSGSAAGSTKYKR
jgi:hypothetical protein